MTVPDLRAMLEGLGTDPGGCRDRALLLLGFAGALRRSELVGLDVADVTEGTAGLTVHLRRSKTDQEGAGRTLGIPYGSNPVTCPVRAWRVWLEVSGITEGSAFRPVDRHGHIGATRLSGQAVALVLKRLGARRAKYRVKRVTPIRGGYVAASVVNRPNVLARLGRGGRS